MIFSQKKLLIFNLKPKRRMFLLRTKYLIAVLCSISWSITMAQENEKELRKANDLIYEGNALITEDFVSAETEYRKAISKLPDNAVGSYNLGHAYFNSGHFDEALHRHIEAAENAVDKNEKHAAFHNIGNILMEKELCKEAVEAYKNALRNDPTDDESRYNLALAKECAKNQGGGDGEDEKDKDEKKDENDENKDQKEDGDNNEDQNEEGDDKEDKSEGDDNEGENGKPNDEKDDKTENEGGDQKKKQKQPQPGKLSPQQVKNLLEAMNNQEKKVQDKINAKKTKGVKIRTEKDW
jgi:tetratricopeptide (TPR) repeat protein